MSEAADPPAPPTAPASFQITVRGVGGEAEARALGETVGTIVRELSRYIDLSTLDGVTVAGDYMEALAELDRGYVTTHQLSPSNGAAVGIAMTPSVLRGPDLKSHIVLHSGVIESVRDLDSQDFPWALHTLAHECAHVAVTAAFDRCFPNTLLRRPSADLQDAFRWQIILACWDEYAATRLSAPFGEAPTDGYETTLLRVVDETRPTVQALIRAYRLHGDVDRVLAEVYGACGDLLKFAAYLLGDVDGRGSEVAKRPSLVAALQGHWFAPHFDALHRLCRALAADFGEWRDQAGFERIGDLADLMVREHGVYLAQTASGLRADIPFSSETMPLDNAR